MFQAYKYDLLTIITVIPVLNRKYSTPTEQLNIVDTNMHIGVIRMWCLPVLNATSRHLFNIAL